MPSEPQVGERWVGVEDKEENVSKSVGRIKETTGERSSASPKPVPAGDALCLTSINGI